MNQQDRQTLRQIRHQREGIKNDLMSIEVLSTQKTNLLLEVDGLSLREQELEKKLGVRRQKSVNMEKKIRFLKEQMFNLMSIDSFETNDIGYLLTELMDLSKELLEILKVATHTDQICVQIALEQECGFVEQAKALLVLRRELEKERNGLRNEVDVHETREEVMKRNKEEMIQLDRQIWKTCQDREQLDNVYDY
uniref:Coiled-coil domain-containing protein 22 homolog n=1 Tax=Rhabditophanes sp. KR3021 TaxID=114890 RepID=A0AC35TID1_9BILA